MSNCPPDVATPADCWLACDGLGELDAVAAQLIAFADDCTVWLLEGEMGAGKTTLVKAICRQLGVTDPVQSPTFALVNEYRTPAGQPVYHFDFYRIRSEAEAMDMGVEEYFDSGHLCLVEWSARIASLWPLRYLHIHLTVGDDNLRTIHLRKIAG